MNKNTGNTKRGRGRPRKEIKLPKGSKFTINDVVAANPHVECRLSIYTKVGEMIRNRVLRYTGATIPTGGVGKPLDELQTMASFRASRSAKRAAKARKLAKLTVDLTPTPTPAAPVAAPAAPAAPVTA